MQTCKHFFAIFIALNLFLCGAVFAQSSLPSLPSVPKGPPKSSSSAAPNSPTSPTSPTAPSGSTLDMPSTSVQMPQMPSVAAPVSGSSFYTPGTQYQQNQKSTEQSKEEKTIEKSVASMALEQMLTGTSTSAFSGLTAWDLNQLAQNGAIGSLFSLSALTNNSSYINNLSGTLTSANQQKLLSQILQELEQIKEAQKNLTAAPDAGTKPSDLPPKIVRFNINSKNILETCTQVYFSEQENNGTFLLTGDARTLVGKETISETFCLLFIANGTKNSMLEYSVSPTIIQSKQVETPLKTFCSVQNFTASRTGNLVRLIYTVNDNTFDLLLDVGTAR